MSALRKHKSKLIWIAVALIFLWWSWGFWMGVANSIHSVWQSRPETVVGLTMIIWPFLAAFPTHYYLNVRRTTDGGVIEVKGFADYIGHGLLSLIVGITYNGSVFVGLFILIFGWNIY